MRSDRENTGNLKIQFEWVPCNIIISKEIIYGIYYICAKI